MLRRILIALCPMVLVAGTLFAADVPEGKGVYEKTCSSCHDSGLAGAPKLGDSQTWQGRLEKGLDTLVAHAIEGFQGSAGFMPAKGGNPSLSDAEVEAAVTYMVEQSR